MPSPAQSDGIQIAGRMRAKADPRNTLVVRLPMARDRARAIHTHTERHNAQPHPEPHYRTLSYSMLHRMTKRRGGARPGNGKKKKQKLNDKADIIRNCTANGSNIHNMKNNSTGRRILELKNPRGTFFQSFSAATTEGVIYCLWHCMLPLIYIGQSMYAGTHRLWQHIESACKVFSSKNEGYHQLIHQEMARQGQDKAKLELVSNPDNPEKITAAIANGWNFTVLEEVDRANGWFDKERGSDARRRLFYKAATPRENFWIRKFESHTRKFGLNAGFAGRGKGELRYRRCRKKRIKLIQEVANDLPLTIDQMAAPLRRQNYGSPIPRCPTRREAEARAKYNHLSEEHADIAWDLEKRALAFVDKWLEQQVKYEEYTPRTLAKLLIYLKSEVTKHYVRRSFQHLGRNRAGEARYRMMLKDLRDNLRRVHGWKTTKTKKDKTFVPHITIPMLHKDFEVWAAKIQECCKANQHLLPRELQPTIGSPEVYFSYDLPMKLGVCNATNVLNELDLVGYQRAEEDRRQGNTSKNEYLEGLKHKHCNCKEYHSKFYGKGKQHVTTMDLQILEQPELAETMGKGLNFRPPRQNGIRAKGAAYVAVLMMEVVTEAMANLKQQVEQILVEANQKQDVSAWLKCLEEDIGGRIKAQNENVDVDCETAKRIAEEANDKRRAREARKLPMYYPAFETQLQQAHAKWAITAADKLKNTPVICCKYAMLEEACKEYTRQHQHGDQPFYTRLEETAKQKWEECRQIIDDLQMTPMRYDTDSGSWIQHHSTSMTKADMTAKVLKPELKWRHLASGANVVMTPLYQWLARGLSAMQDETTPIWLAIQRESRMPQDKEVPRMMIDSADELFDRVADMNTRPNPTSPMATYDVEQLFTNIDQDDLKQKMHELIEMVWEHKVTKRRERMQVATRARQMRLTTEHMYLVIYAKKLKKDPEWLIKTEVGRMRNSVNKRIVAMEDLKQWVTLAVDHSYVRVGGDLLKQSMGIPMGMNASPFLSNLYMFMYELSFMKQFMRRKKDREFFAKHFRYCARFQDDRWAAANQYEEKAMYVEQRWGKDGERQQPWHGIYPGAYLKVTKEDEDFDHTTHQDVHIHRRPSSNQKDGMPTNYYYYTDVYDRKFDSQFDSVRGYMVLYQQPNTQLADACVYGVVYSEMNRFSKRCSEEEDFVKAVTRMTTTMVRMGYNKGKIKSKVQRFAKEVPQLFFRNGAREWARRICKATDDEAKVAREREKEGKEQ